MLSVRPFLLLCGITIFCYFNAGFFPICLLLSHDPFLMQMEILCHCLREKKNIQKAKRMKTILGIRISKREKDFKYKQMIW